MDANGHVCRPCFYRSIYGVDVIVDQFIWVLTAPPYDLAIFGIAQNCNGHLIHLQVGAATGSQISNLFTHHPRQIREKHLTIWVN